MSSDRKASIFLLLFCAIDAVFTAQLPTNTINGAPGPQVFPWIMLGLLTVLSLVLFFKSGSKENEKPKDSLKQSMLIFGAMALYFAMVPYVGFLLGTIIGITLFLRISVKSWKTCILVAGGTAIVLYGVFKLWLHINLPQGLILPF